jgi:hypothetical protein
LRSTTFEEDSTAVTVSTACSAVVACTAEQFDATTRTTIGTGTVCVTPGTANQRDCAAHTASRCTRTACAAGSNDRRTFATCAPSVVGGLAALEADTACLAGLVPSSEQSGRGRISRIAALENDRAAYVACTA